MDIGNGADPDQTPQNVASDQGLHSLLTGNYIRNRIKMIQDIWQPLKTNKVACAPSEDSDQTLIGSTRAQNSGD